MEDLNEQEINSFLDAIKKVSDYNFEEYSIKSFTRRLQKILSDEKLDMDDLINKISSNKVFLEQIVKDITVNTTEIFRDPEIWTTINQTIIPKFKDEPNINIWHAGASTGQEVYTMLIMLKQHGIFDRSNVYASDINTDVLDVAKSGKYKYREIDEYIKNFNTTYGDNENKYDINDYFKISRIRNLMKVRSILLNKVQYKKHDLTTLTNPFSVKYNMLFCRNVLIYFNHKLQNKIFQTFYDSLKTGGVLIVGKHESMLGGISDKFEKKGTIYIKK